jgi:hypothetical protein
MQQCLGCTCLLSAFRTREDRQPTNEFVAACPCPDGLMQDGTQEGKMRLMLPCTGVLIVGVTSVTRERERESEREREFGLEVSCLSLPPPVSLSACPVCVSLWKALDIPFYRHKEMPSCTMGV